MYRGFAIMRFKLQFFFFLKDTLIYIYCVKELIGFTLALHKKILIVVHFGE